MVMGVRMHSWMIIRSKVSGSTAPGSCNEMWQKLSEELELASAELPMRTRKGAEGSWVGNGAAS